MYAYIKYGMAHTGLDTQRPYHWSGDTVADMLENEIYLGNTVNYRFSTKSYKDKRKMEHPREECLVFENTHPAIISKEVWDIVQRVRKNKRRPTKMNEQNKYSGLVVCADCGKAMVLHRAHTMSADYNHFTCRTYKKDGEACTAHYIRECILDEIVLEDLRRVTAEAREHPQEFAEYLNSKQSAELQKEICKLEKEKSAMQKRKAELDAIFKKLYEESVLGRITAEQFQMLVASYTDEQAKLTESLPQRESEIQRLKETVEHEFFHEFMKRIARNHKIVYILGEKSEQIKALVGFLKEHYPRVTVSGVFALEDCPGDYESIINEVNGEAADVVISVIPSPQQEEFLMNYKSKMSAKVWYGIGEVTGLYSDTFLKKIFRKIFHKHVLLKRIEQYENEDEERK